MLVLGLVSNIATFFSHGCILPPRIRFGIFKLDFKFLIKSLDATIVLGYYLSMKFDKRVISLILLLAFSLNIAGELVTSFNGFLPQKLSNVNQSESSYTLVTDSLDQNSDLSPLGACEDLCHLGSCHFGHCSHLVKADLKLSSIAVFEATHPSWNVSVPSNPYLEFPKQPPRFLQA